MGIGRFYAGIGALIRRTSDGRYLLLKRSQEKDFAGGVWECVTGRVDQGESFAEAVHREVGEEIGLAVQIEFIIGTTHFYRGPDEPENELLGVVYSCAAADTSGLRLSREHSEYRWVTVEEARTLLTAVDASTQWTKLVVERAERIRVHIPSSLLGFYRDRGFELG